MISVENLTKYYGSHLAVDDISFQIEDGHVYGFLGPNGAGKSTTMNIITGCLSATAGTVKIAGYDIFEQPREAKKLIGYLPEQPPLYMNETPLDYLRFVGKAKGIKGAQLQEQIDEVIQKTGIENVKHRRIATLSKGYKQRVGIAQALLGNPKVIILDEPTVGLDPVQILEIRSLITELGQTHTVILSSHILSEVQTLCDQIMIIAKGRLIAFDSPENLEKNMVGTNEIIITTNATEDGLKELLSTVPGITEVSVEPDSIDLVTAHVGTDHDNIYEISGTIHHLLADKGITLYEMTVKKANLEDIFLELTDAVVSDPVEAETTGDTPVIAITDVAEESEEDAI